MAKQIIDDELYQKIMSISTNENFISLKDELGRMIGMLDEVFSLHVGFQELKNNYISYSEVYEVSNYVYLLEIKRELILYNDAAIKLLKSLKE